MFKVYVLYSKKFKKSYVGYSRDIIKRLSQHNNGEVTSTRNWKPWEVIYEELCESELLARRRERYYKSATGRRTLKSIFDKLGINKNN